MFKIFTKYFSTVELKVILHLWKNMISYFHSLYIRHDCSPDKCEKCEYKRLCGAFYNTESYLDKEIKKRETNESE